MVLKFLVLLLCTTATNPLVELERMRYTDTSTPKQVAKQVEQALGQLTGDSRLDKCRNAFIQGEIYRRAALVLSESDYANQALKSYRLMRVDYMDLTMAQMGYIGEARILRQQGKLDMALKVLNPLTGTATDRIIRQLAMIEKGETWLDLNPKEVLLLTRKLGDEGKWLTARAYLKLDQKQKAIELLRDPVVVKSAPAFARLMLLASHDKLNEQERIQLAQIWISVGQKQKAMKLINSADDLQSILLHAQLLTSAKQYELAAAQWAKMVSKDSSPKYLWLYAQCLEASLSTQPLWKEKTIDTYWLIVSSQSQEPLKKAALRQWVFLNGFEDSKFGLLKQQPLIKDDAYLMYAWAMTRRKEMKSEQMIAELKQVIELANNKSLQASAILTCAKIQPDPRQSLQLIEQHWELLSTQSGTSGATKAMRLELWLKLGVVDQAVDQILSQTKNYSPDLLISTAEALAERYKVNKETKLRQKVVRLASTALQKSPTDQQVAISVAELLICVDALADADRVLKTLPSDQASLMRANIYYKVGKHKQALEVLDGVALSNSGIIRAQCLLALNNPQKAMAPARAVRSKTRPGTDTWWQATILLARAQKETGDVEAAKKLIRIAQTLYPPNDTNKWQSQIQSIQQESDQ